MSYNKYNTRHSGRFNTPGHFVPAEQLPGSPMQRRIDNAQRFNSPNTNFNNTPAQAMPAPQTPQQLQPPAQSNVQPLHAPDVEMKSDPPTNDTKKEEGFARPAWMKTKLNGMKKITNKERRRRQNAHLRRLLSPKNALMALNELLLNEQISNEFKVEPAVIPPFYNQPLSNFCAELTIEGNVYKGYGETKIGARNAAAELAIRDIMIKKMKKILTPEGGASGTGAAGGAGGAGGTGGAGGEGGAGGSECDDALPMIQLASFALHKLFAEWECDGHKVPQLKPPQTSVSETESLSGDKTDSESPRPKKKARTRALPLNAAAMHPAMLLTYMRPLQEYRELAAAGDKPQNMLYTVCVDVDGQTYVGKAPNKKEARKAAARAACAALFNVTFNENASATAPVHAPTDNQ